MIQEETGTTLTMFLFVTHFGRDLVSFVVFPSPLDVSGTSTAAVMFSMI